MYELTGLDGPLKGVRLVRIVNEHRVLEAVLERSAASKAELSRVTGLSKSTVSAVVDDLERAGILTQTNVTVGAIGRPSVLYAVDPSAGHIVGIDLGGTKLLAGLSDLLGGVLAEIEVPTAKGSASELLEQISIVVDRLFEEAGVARSSLRAVAIGVPGIYEESIDSISGAYNLPALADIRLQARLEEMLDVPVSVANDVNFAALGEHRHGHGRAFDSFVSLSIGTGVGMGIIVDGHLLTGRRGAAGEVGHLPVAVDDPFDGSYRSKGGPLEAVVSGPALAARAREIRGGSTASTLPAEPTTFDVFAAAATGDTAASQAVDEEARAIALAIAAVGAVLDPELVVLSGGIGVQPALLEPVRGYLKDLLPDPPNVLPSELGSRAALSGAMEAGLRAARQELLWGAGNATGKDQAARRAVGLKGGSR